MRLDTVTELLHVLVYLLIGFVMFELRKFNPLALSLLRAHSVIYKDRSSLPRPSFGC
jgi:hypothetical protein